MRLSRLRVLHSRSSHCHPSLRLAPPAFQQPRRRPLRQMPAQFILGEMQCLVTSHKAYFKSRCFRMKNPYSTTFSAVPARNHFIKLAVLSCIHGKCRDQQRFCPTFAVPPPGDLCGNVISHGKVETQSPHTSTPFSRPKLELKNTCPDKATG